MTIPVVPMAEIVNMGTGTFPAWRGFERAPEGRLLAQVVDLSMPMGVAYERSVRFRKDFHVHDRHMLVCPRGSSVMRLSTRRPAREFEIDSTMLMIVPRHLEHDDEGLTVVYDTMALYPDDALAGEGTMFAEPRVVQRTPWLATILERYFVERLLVAPTRQEATYFLERQILDEVRRILAFDGTAREPTTELSADDPFDRALRHVEARLFEKVTLGELARAAGASSSTLLRMFRERIQQTPYQYVKRRRLDEARMLLRAGRGVHEVALLVGYEDPGAFSRAYKAHFGHAPSAVMR